MERQYHPNRIDVKGLPSARWVMAEFAPNQEICLLNLMDLEVLRVPRLCDRILAEGIICNGNVKRIRENDLRYYRCGRKKCRSYHNLLQRTIFADSKVGAHEIILMAYYWLCGDTHASIVSKTGYHVDTVTSWMRRFEELIHWDLTESEDEREIGGEGITVHIDESKFGKRKYHRGHHVEGVWVVGGVETNTVDKRTFFVTVQDRSAETLVNIINTHVLPGSIVHTDLWRGYRDEDLLNLDIAHATVNHSEHFVDPRTGVHTQNIEGVWSALKRSISIRQRTEALITGLLYLYMWRRIKKGKYWEAFIDILRRYRLEDDDENP